MEMGQREKDQADFDLERLIDIFDEALTSRDPRVIDTLRSLMMITALTRPESRNSGLHDRNAGPLRRLYDDVQNLNRRLHRVENELQQVNHASRQEYAWEEKEQYAIKAAAQMAQSVDNEIVRKFLAQNTAQINSGQIKGSK